MRAQWLGLVLVIAGAAAWLAYQQWGGGPLDAGAEEISLKPQDRELVALGEEIYSVHCSSCHKADLSGEANWRERDAQGRLPAPPHDETGHTWHHPDEVLFALTKHGPAALVGGDYQSNMPGYADTLSDREIVAVLSYIKSRWPADIQARHDEINAQN